MRNLMLWLILGGVACARLASAQAEDPRVQKLVALMPAVADLPDFKVLLEPEVYPPETLSDHIDGEVEAFNPYEVGSTVTAILARGTTRVQTDIFDMMTPLGAYGVFSTHRPPKPERAAVGTDSFIDDTALVFFAGDYYVDLTVMGRRDDAREVLTLIAKAIEGKIHAERTLPPELDLFPEAGRLADTDQYIPRGHLGIELVPNAFVVQYERNGVLLRASLSLFESEDAATKAFEALSQHIVEKAEGAAQGELDRLPVVTGSLKYRGVLAATVQGQRLLTVCGGEDAEAVKALLHELAESCRSR